MSISRSFASFVAIVGLAVASPTFAGVVDVCDVDGDGVIGSTFDVEAIFAARGTPASGPDDDRDYNRDGIITVNDGRGCVLVDGSPSMVVNPASATIGFDPASPLVVSNGDVVDVDVVVSDLGSGIVSAFDLDITYDDSLLAAIGISFSGALGNPLLFETFQDSDISVSGVVDVAALSLLSDTTLATLQSGPVTLVTVQFSAIGTGDAALGFIFDAYNDVKGGNNEVLPLRVQQVPEPSTWALLGAGLFGLGFIRRRRTA